MPKGTPTTIPPFSRFGDWETISETYMIPSATRGGQNFNDCRCTNCGNQLRIRSSHLVRRNRIECRNCYNERRKLIIQKIVNRKVVATYRGHKEAAQGEFVSSGTIYRWISGKTKTPGVTWKTINPREAEL